MSVFGQTSLARSDMSYEYWTSRLESKELSQFVDQTCQALVRQVWPGHTCSANIGQVRRTSWVGYVMPWSDLSDNMFLLIKLQTYLAGFSKA
jgi:hypothetical protein